MADDYRDIQDALIAGTLGIGEHGVVEPREKYGSGYIDDEGAWCPRRLRRRPSAHGPRRNAWGRAYDNVVVRAPTVNDIRALDTTFLDAMARRQFIPPGTARIEIDGHDEGSVIDPGTPEDFEEAPLTHRRVEPGTYTEVDATALVAPIWPERPDFLPAAGEDLDRLAEQLGFQRNWDRMGRDGAETDESFRERLLRDIDRVYFTPRQPLNWVDMRGACQGAPLQEVALQEAAERLQRETHREPETEFTTVYRHQQTQMLAALLAEMAEAGADEETRAGFRAVWDRAVARLDRDTAVVGVDWGNDERTAVQVMEFHRLWDRALSSRLTIPLLTDDDEDHHPMEDVSSGD